MHLVKHFQQSQNVQGLLTIQFLEYERTAFEGGNSVVFIYNFVERMILGSGLEAVLYTACETID